VIEHAARIRIQLPTGFPEARLFLAVALRLAPPGGSAAGRRAPMRRRARQINPKRFAL
jgi:hypothetical protein